MIPSQLYPAHLAFSRDNPNSFHHLPALIISFCGLSLASLLLKYTYD
jgi:hypothetical protein